MKRKREEDETRKKKKKKNPKGHRELCEVYFYPDGSHEILKSEMTQVDDGILMDTVRARGLDKALFKEFLTSTIIRGRPVSSKNPEIGCLLAAWHAKSQKRKEWYHEAEEEDGQKKKKRKGYSGSFQNVPEGLRDAITFRDHPSVHMYLPVAKKPRDKTSKKNAS